MAIYHGSSLFPEPLTKEEEIICLEKMANGDEEARNMLIERNLRLVAHVAKKYSNTKVDQDDLISIGTIGLIKGVKSFSIEKGSRLSTYVSRCIDNEILMHLRATKKINAELYLNEKMKNILKDREKTIIELRFGLDGHKPKTQNEIAKSMGISRSYVSRIETKAINKLSKEIKE